MGSTATHNHIYECQKHGPCDALILSVAEEGKIKHIGKYCFLCYNEFLGSNVTQVTEIKKDGEEVVGDKDEEGSKENV